jgi:hypothetical protein
MKAVEILAAFADPDQGEFRGALIEEVIAYMDHGMHDEWDIGFIDGIKEGFAGQELQIAARSAYSLAKWQEENDA